MLLDKTIDNKCLYEYFPPTNSYLGDRDKSNLIELEDEQNYYLVDIQGNLSELYNNRMIEHLFYKAFQKSDSKITLLRANQHLQSKKWYKNIDRITNFSITVFYRGCSYSINEIPEDLQGTFPQKAIINVDIDSPNCSNFSLNIALWQPFKMGCFPSPQWMKPIIWKERNCELAQLMLLYFCLEETESLPWLSEEAKYTKDEILFLLKEILDLIQKIFFLSRMIFKLIKNFLNAVKLAFFI